MNRFVALTLMIIVPVAGVLLTYGLPQAGNEFQSPLESMTVLDAAAMIHQEARKRTDLDAEFLRVATRIARKREIAHKVIDNALSLSEAAALFRGLIDECPYVDLVHNANKGMSEDERIFRDVIGWVEGELAHDPMRVAMVVRRLEEEVKSLFP